LRSWWKTWRQDRMHRREGKCDASLFRISYFVLGRKLIVLYMWNKDWGSLWFIPICRGSHLSPQTDANRSEWLHQLSRIPHNPGEAGRQLQRYVCSDDIVSLSLYLIGFNIIGRQALALSLCIVSRILAQAVSQRQFRNLKTSVASQNKDSMGGIWMLCSLSPGQILGTTVAIQRQDAWAAIGLPVGIPSTLDNLR
jgi:hypothetical protein